MTGEKHLLLLAAFIILTRWTRCQKPQVTMTPMLKQIFSGDTFYLTCGDDTSETQNVKWYINNSEQTSQSKDWKIPFANSANSGTYHCENNSQRSDDLLINVLEYVPMASLTIQTGHPVMQTGRSVILKLQNDDGLEGWRCAVYRGDKKPKMVLLRNTGTGSVEFQTSPLEVPETIYWCSDRNKEKRSNQITLRTSDKPVAMEMYPLPAVTGEALTLRCLVWGTDEISEAKLYKDNNGIHTFRSETPIINIANVTESTHGRYKCSANFTYKGHTDGPQRNKESDDQEVFVQVPPIKPVLSSTAGTHLSCSCQSCASDTSYYWYSKSDPGWKHIHSSPDKDMKPKENGPYACRAVWKDKRSLLSNAEFFVSEASPVNTIVVALIVILIIIIVVAVVSYKLLRRRNDTMALYEDVGLRSRDKDDKYEMLHVKPGAQKEAEYDTLHTEAQGKEKKEGEYEPLKKEEMKEGVYQTVGAEGAARGEGGYEALKKEGVKEGVYHTLGMEGAAGGEGGEGGYEALKKGEVKVEVYHTLSAEGAAGGDGGYEALKKDVVKEEVYHTLSMEGAAGGEGGYEAQKKEGVNQSPEQDEAAGGAKQ